MANEELGIAELKARLSEVLRLVADGRSVTITDRGTPVARLIPIEDQDRNWKRLVEEGVIIPARRKHGITPLPDPVDIGSHPDLFERHAI